MSNSNKYDKEIDKDGAEEGESKESEVSYQSVGINAGLSEGNSPEFKWYVAHTLSGRENKVSQTLKDRIMSHNLQDYFSKILVPEETVVKNHAGKKRSLKKKFFPGYILIKMIMNDKTWHLVRKTEKITGFLGGEKNKPSPISDEDAKKLVQQVSEGFRKVKKGASFSEGETVKVIEGPFTSFVGTVENVSEKGKIRVQVSIFGRPTPVELDFTQVEKIS